MQWKDHPQILKRIEDLSVDYSWEAIAYIISREFEIEISGESLRKLRGKHVKVLKNRKVKYGVRDVYDQYNRKLTDPKLKWEEDGNYATLIQFADKSPRTLPELLEVIKFDADIWKVDKWEATKWDTPMKFGYKGSEKPISVPNYRINAKFIRIVPIKHEWGTFKPIKIQSAKKFKINTVKRGMYRAVIIPDSQNGFWRNIETNIYNPFHDRRAWDICLQMVQALKPDRIILLGDMIDFAMYSDKFIKSPEFYFTTQPSLNELSWWLSALADSGAQIDYIEGNHESRLTKSIINNQLENYKLRPANRPNDPPALSVKSLLGLNQLGIKYHGDYPNGEIWLNDNVRGSHGSIVRQGSGDSVKAIINDARCTELVGHTHRAEAIYKTVFPRKGAVTYGAVSFGTISRIDGHVPANKKKNNWQQACGMVHYELGNGLFNTTLQLINNGQTVYNGKIYTYRNRVKEIGEACGYDFAKGMENGWKAKGG